MSIPPPIGGSTLRLDPPFTPRTKQMSFAYATPAATVRDVHVFLNTYGWLKDKLGRTIPWRYNNCQRMILHRKREAIRRGRRMRFLVAKFRRLGASQYEIGSNTALAMFQPGAQCITLADVKDKSRELFRAANLIYARTPPALRPKRKHENRQLLNFEEIGSYYSVGTAGAVTFARGLTLQRAHGSEVAYWLLGRPADEVTALVAGITEAASHGEVTFESTANGDHGWWYDTVMEAHTGRSEWTLIFLEWFLDPTLRIEPSKYERQEILDTLTEREKWLVQVHKLDLAQLLWRRRKSQERAMRLLFLQEYPETVEEMFLTTVDGFFPIDLIQRLQAEAQADTGQPIRTEGPFTFWEDYNPSHTYVIGADCAEGTPESDPQAAYVLDTKTGRYVAAVHGRFPVETYAAHLSYLGRLYGTALIAVERETTAGGATLQHLMHVLHYPQIYYEKVFDDKRKARRKMGWSTNEFTRPVMLADLRDALDEGSAICLDKDLPLEMRTFERNDKGKYEARDGSNDDRVMAAAITWQARRKRLELPTIHIL